mmetsp:Transcript_20287/g.28319  ORF Transcript_20287/g.28319 Transcript_20287/m.28319 type:complete len:595 (-) Transcript_20287:545-2329(-)
MPGTGPNFRSALRTSLALLLVANSFALVSSAAHMFGKANKLLPASLSSLKASSSAWPLPCLDHIFFPNVPHGQPFSYQKWSRRALRGSLNLQQLRVSRRGLSVKSSLNADTGVGAGTVADAEEGQARSSLRYGPDKPQRIVVLGGGFGGLYTALKLADLKWKTSPEITLVDVSDRFLFKPLMYELISGEATLDQVAPLFRDLIGASGVRFVQHEVTAVTLADTEKKLAGRAKLDDGSTIDYDFLVMGVGAETNLNLSPGAKENAIGFNTLDDVRKLEKALQDIEDEETQKPVSISVVGGGPSGVELAAVVADRLEASVGASMASISLYVAGDEILESATADARTVAKSILNEKNVKVLYSNKIEKVAQKDGKKFEISINIGGKGETKTADTNLVIWAAGSKAVGVKGIPQEGGGRMPISIDKNLLIKGRQREFALGDVAEMGLPANAQVALQQSDYCAWNIFASVNSENLLPFRFQNLGTLMALGSLEAAATLNLPGVGDVTLKGPVASGLRKLAYIYRMPTNQQRLKVATEWLQSPEMWIPPEVPSEMKELEKFNPFVGAPNFNKLLDEKELKEAFGALFDRFQAGTGGRRRN